LAIPPLRQLVQVLERQRVRTFVRQHCRVLRTLRSRSLERGLMSVYPEKRRARKVQPSRNVGRSLAKVPDKVSKQRSEEEEAVAAVAVAVLAAVCLAEVSV
jgi:hypothetical protein